MLNGGNSQSGHHQKNHRRNAGGAPDTFAIRGTLTAQLSVRHISHDPFVVKNVMVDAVANREITIADTNDA